MEIFNEITLLESLKCLQSQGFLVHQGSSIITSIVRQIIVDFVNINLSNENVNTGVSREIIFQIFIHVLS